MELNAADIPAFIPLALSEIFVFSDSPVITALFLTVAAFSEKLSFKVEPVLTALSLNTAAVSFSRAPVFHAPLARTDPPYFAVSLSTDTVFTVLVLTDDADDASECFRWPALDQRLAVKSVGGTVSSTAVDSCHESKHNVILHGVHQKKILFCSLTFLLGKFNESEQKFQTI